MDLCQELGASPSTRGLRCEIHQEDVGLGRWFLRFSSEVYVVGQVGRFVLSAMAGGKQAEGSAANPSAIRIRDNQRRSRARHKEYVEGLQKKIQDYEKRGVEATLEMQQAARNVAVENSRLRILLGYHGVTNEDIEKFLQTFPDQSAGESSKAAASQLTAPQQSVIAIAPKMPLQPISRPSSAGPARADYVVPKISHETTTREAVDAIVGIKRKIRSSEHPSPLIPQRAPQIESRQPLLQPRPQPLTLPALPTLGLVPSRRDPVSVDKLSVLATASAQQDGHNLLSQPRLDNLHIHSPPTIARSPSTSTSAPSTSRLHSTSPRSQELSLNPQMATSRVAPSQGIHDIHGNLDPELSKSVGGSNS